MQFPLCELFRITPDEIRARKAFLHIDDSVVHDLSRVRGLIIREMDAIINEFYERLEDQHALDRFMSDRITLGRLKDAQRLYLGGLGLGMDELKYYEDRLRIGVVHEKVGLQQKWYLGSYSILFGIIAKHVGMHFQTEPDTVFRLLSSLHKAFALDSILTVETYYQATTQRLESILSQLTDAQHNLQELSRLDGLTGLSNRKFVMESIEMELFRSLRFGHQFSLVLIDIDHFKSVNDRFGHAHGDDVLRVCAQLIRETVRPADIVGRYGGEEFVVGLVECGQESAHHILERIRLRMAHHLFQVDDKSLHVSVSIGAATLGTEKDRIESLFRCADAALYRAKAGGRNQVCFSD